MIDLFGGYILRRNISYYLVRVNFLLCVIYSFIIIGLGLILFIFMKVKYLVLVNRFLGL